jgi:predicted nuclease of predicted toxin-antitoxin system
MEVFDRITWNAAQMNGQRILMKKDIGQALEFAGANLADEGMQRASDEEILAIAADQGRVVITLDSDFHALLAVRGPRGPSVIRLRREGCRLIPPWRY